MNQDKNNKINDKTFNRISMFISQCGAPMLFILRFLSVFFVISGFDILIKHHIFDPVADWQAYIQSVDLARNILFSLLGTIVLSLLYRNLKEKYRSFDQIFALIAILFFDTMYMLNVYDPYSSIALFMLTYMMINFIYGSLNGKSFACGIPDKVSIALVISFAAAMCAVTYNLQRMVHNTFNSHCYDFGIFIQMFHSLVEHGNPLTTCERFFIISHFNVHTSYIFLLLVPFYKLFPSIKTLYTAHSLLSMGGIIPMYLLVKKHGYNGLSRIFLCMGYILCIGIVMPSASFLHENSFLPTLLMWLFWALDNKKYKLMYIMAFLVLLVKEDAPTYVLCTGLYLFMSEFGKKSCLHGLALSLISGIYMLLAIRKLAHGGDINIISVWSTSHLAFNNGGIVEIIKNAFSNPAYFCSLLMSEGTFMLFIRIMLPLMFLPLITKKASRYMLLVPLFFMVLIIGAGYESVTIFINQYIQGPVIPLMYLCIINMDDIQDKNQKAVLVGMASYILTATVLAVYVNFYSSEYKINRDKFTQAQQILDSLPKDAAIAAEDNILPHIADRDKVYFLTHDNFLDPNGKGEVMLIDTDKCDFIALSSGTDICEFYQSIMEEKGYELYAKTDDLMYVYKNKKYTGGIK